MGTFHDLYIIKWLLQNIQESQGLVMWHRGEDCKYFADFGEESSVVCVKIGKIPTSTGGGRMFTKLSSAGLGEVEILEPTQKVLSLKRKYDTPEETELAETMNCLLVVASHQYVAREQHQIDTAEDRKQAIFQRLLGKNNSQENHP